MELTVQSTIPEKFLFQDKQPLRAILDEENNPWFLAADCCAAIGVNNVSDVLSRLDSDEKSEIETKDRLGRDVKVWVVNEPGLYRLVLGSRKPIAATFKRWVVHEVIPTIRRYGLYAIRPEGAPTPAQLLKQTAEVLLLHDEAIRDHDARLLLLEAAANQGTSYFTVDGYCVFRKLSKNKNELKLLETQAATLSRAYGRPISKVHDPVKGKAVSIYHINVLDEAAGVNTGIIPLFADLASA